MEAVTDHDVIAFLTAWADNTTPREAAAWVHYGMTSSDLLDTALALQLAEATDLLIGRATQLVAVLREHGLAHASTLRVGRTHGIHAEPDVWGHRVADFAFAMARSRDRLARARDAVAVGKLSGPVGTYSNIDPAIEATVMDQLGLRAADVATQVVFRDGIAEWASALAMTATACEAIALEVRHGQRTEVRELMEPFRAGQKGSSAMPHKKNPIRSERICGIARMVRGYVTPVMEGMPLWHERDISHSSVERIALPDAAIATDYLLHLTTGLVQGLVVDAGADAGQPGLHRRPGLHLQHPARAGGRGDVPGGRLRAGPGGRDGHLVIRGPAGRHAARRGRLPRQQPLDEARLDEICQPERYVPGSAPSSSGWSPGWHEPAAAPAVLRQGTRRLRDRDGLLLLVATDRISAFDYVLPTPIPDKGKILTQLSLWWFEQLADVVPNHLADAEIPAEFAGRAMACQRLSMVPVECVARGYLAGSGLREYQRTGAVCGVRAAAWAQRGLQAARADLHPGDQGATRAARREHPSLGRGRGVRPRPSG